MWSDSIALIVAIIAGGIAAVTGFGSVVRSVGRVGGQPGRHPAALLGFELDKRCFVATATAIGLFVDGARMPVYVATQHEELIQLWEWIVAATAGVTIGTVLGSRVLARIPEVSVACSLPYSRFWAARCYFVDYEADSRYPTARNIARMASGDCGRERRERVPAATSRRIPRAAHAPISACPGKSTSSWS
jgi:hypothetical protein